MSSITRFQIAIPNEKLTRLQQQLSLYDLPTNDTTIDQPWVRGPPVSDVNRLAHYWQHSFNWREVEAQLNKLPQFIAKVEVDDFDTYDIHFIHQRSQSAKAIPLLFVHGWPGSFLEVTKMLPLLSDVGKEGGPVFHVVAPSLIDFGFSSANTKEKFHIDQQAEACHKLMLALGYNEYVVQGGDIGSLVARFIARKYGPTHCKAHHIIGPVPAEPSATSHPELHAKLASISLTPSELAGLGRTAAFSKSGMGYYQHQSTRPLALAYALTSPIPLLSYIYDKLHSWSDSYPWTDEEILTWVSIYYFSTAGPGASLNFFYANEHRLPEGAFDASKAYVAGVKLGTSRFKGELILLPRGWEETMGELVFQGVEHERGGHFGGWENPEAVVGDLRGLLLNCEGLFG